jgi:hypothetical protein
MSDKPDTMATFDWVKARAYCSLAHVFKQLELGARNDVDIANRERQSGVPHTFSISTEPGRFSVIRSSGMALPVSVEFSLEGHEIVACIGNQILLQATITLNNEGRCMLKVGGEELEQWHVRRMALEDLFFGKGGPPMPRAGQ